jgi:hypothetical protein
MSKSFGGGARLATLRRAADHVEAATPRSTAISASAADRRSLQGAADRGEFGVELRADALNRGDNRQRNAASNQAIFDRGRAGLIAQES